MMKKTLFTLCLMMTTLSWAQTISTDAPSMTPSAEVVQPRVFQYEGRIQFTRYSKSNSLDIPLNLFRIGLTKRLEFRTVNGLYSSGGYLNNLQSFGIRSVELGLKYGILANPERKIKMSVLGHYILPEPGSNKYHTLYGSVNVSHQFNERSSLGYSVGSRYSVNQEIPADVITLSASLVYTNKLNDKLYVFAECYGLHSQSYFAGYYEYPQELSADAGAYYLLKDNIQLDYTFGYGINDRMYFHSIGFDIMIAPKKD